MPSTPPSDYPPLFTRRISLPSKPSPPSQTHTPPLTPPKPSRTTARTAARIRRYLSLSPSHDLLLSSISSAYFLSLASLIKECQSHRRRYHYDPDARLLRIHAMVRPVHRAAELLVSHTFRQMIRSATFLTEEEKDVVLVSSPTVQLPTSCYVAAGKKEGKKAAWEKTPDGAFMVGEKMPVVFEVGFSETREELERDARQWLEKGRGRGVRCVVLCCVVEDNKQRVRRRGEMEKDGTLCNLARQFGNKKGKARYIPEFDDSGEEEEEGEEEEVVSNDGSAVSDADLYHLIARTINTNDWVASNLTATMEFWRLTPDGTPARDGNVVQVLPLPSGPQQPAEIRITDLFPDTPDRRERAWRIDLDVYRDLIEKGVKELATVRAVETLRPRGGGVEAEEEWE
ncbi:hypothetical protein K440DRAFT_18701 [Wilcoxina mikolae CBS 423.85]|nr:hypothetical protein K440DRAFT_18701 [Wilcoxina mikolae CBS 423.85]